ncbi:MAG TPA: hypothetical protein VIT62_09705 [Lysobacter sp.]
MEITNDGRLAKKSERRVAIALALASGVAIAGAIVIDGAAAPYKDLSNINGTTIDSLAEIRMAGMTQAAAKYRQLHGRGELPASSTFTMKWGDGSSEGAFVTSPFSSVGAGPLPGTQSPRGRSFDCKKCHNPSGSQ